MLPEPIHPAVVHFPLVLAFLLPISAGGALWAIRKGGAVGRAWAFPLVMAAALTASAWVALETGEREEERVEDIVGSAAIHEHEEAAERFLVLSGVLLLVAAAGMLRGTAGRAARIVATAGSLAVTVAAVNVGGEGGKLVYREGAAQAYVVGAEASSGVSARSEDRGREQEREEEDEHR